MRAPVLALATLAAGSLVLRDIPTAHACGCLSPPAVTEGDFAVNQEAEQIIFEVEPGWVTAHVLIRYAGDPAKFAWIVPVPEVPEMSISPVSAFGIIDRQTVPDISVDTENICPISEWSCAYHPSPSCPSLFGGGGYEDGVPGISLADAGASSYGDASGTQQPVTVIDTQVVGDYQTVTFRASEASAATQWLQDNGFVVNNTTSIYMESYVQANMVFVAAKLVPGAGINGIKPLKMRYRAAFPSVPLILTAVAAEPNLTVTSFIYSNQAFRPQGHPVVTLDEKRIAYDTNGRLNYPQVLARTIDEAGGDGFSIEYRGSPQLPQSTSSCCGNMYDPCHAANDGQCQCPGDTWDGTDCASQQDLVDGFNLVERLFSQYTTLTRITTRVSAEEMTFDPTFEPDFDASPSSQFKLSLHGSQASLSGCANRVIDQDTYAALDAKQACAATYCGPGGSCVVTAAGPACACNEGFVAQRYTDLDAQASVTCVPRTPPVDLRANGEQLPDACANTSCGAGTCIDRNGVAVCQCNAGAAATVGYYVAPHCDAITYSSSTPGADDYSDGLRNLKVCAPPYPVCGDGGWLEHHDSPRPGVNCGGTVPPERLTKPGPMPTCPGAFGCGGCQEAPGAGPSTLMSLFLVGLLVLRRRRGRGR